MKQKRLTNYLKLGILLFGFSLLSNSCQKDDGQFQTTKEIQTDSNIKISTLRTTEIEQNKRLINKISKLKTDIKAKSSNSSNNRDVYNSEYDFTINTDYAKHIDNGINHTYTFPIYRAQDNGLLENLLLVEQNDDTFKAYIVQYEFTEAEITAINFKEKINLENKVTFIEIDDNGLSDDIFGKYYYNGNCYEDNYVYQQASNCTAGGNHSFSDGAYSEDNPSGCKAWGTINMATTGGYVNIPTLVPCDGGGGSPSNGGNPPDYNPTNPNNNPHGGGGSGNPTTPITCKRCPELDTDPVGTTQDECDKITQLFQDYPTLVAALQTNKGQTDLLQERGVYVVNTATIPQNPPIGQNGQVELDAPNGQYICFSHTHNSPANTTYSVPSWGDFVDAIVPLVKSNKLDETRFVGFLFTADGTSYAYTINNITAFNQFWSLPGEPEFSMEQLNKRIKLMKDYYAPNDPSAQPLIQENSNDNITDLKHFLDFINDNNMGVTFFEESNNFTTFEQLTHNKTTNMVDNTPCN
ncbi:hypothetical protein GCM10022271_22800 [Corallibacter vietnamensis]|uniref:Uncharacterized protein n=1 Tax=Corallibacter vietnamensis TaxID=904130 RepID=A0ABP7HEL9_9FLAO